MFHYIFHYFGALWDGNPKDFLTKGTKMGDSHTPAGPPKKNLVIPTANPKKY
jgi:hypothetical protein